MAGDAQAEACLDVYQDRLARSLATIVNVVDPDVIVLQDVPDELKGKDDTKGEASLKGHLKNGEDEKGGSQAYVPPDAKNDKQLIAAEDILRGVVKANNATSAPGIGDAKVTSAPN